MKRTAIADRELPDYTRGEEIFNMVSHIAGGGLAICALVLCVVLSAIHGNTWAIVGSAIYGTTLVVMFTVSSIYHGLHISRGKKIMQVIDHCDIFFLIAGTYSPILLAGIRPIAPALSWAVFGVEWSLAILAAVLNAIDLKKFHVFSMIAYIGMGWCIVLVLRKTIQAMTLPGFLWLLSGGIAYTIGAVLYLIGSKRRYFHCVFHLFVVLGALLQFFSIFLYVI